MSQANTPTAPLTFANALQSLQILTSQTANFTFNIDELTLALTAAWNDSFVGWEAYDSSTQFVAGTYIYPVPSTMITVREMYIILPVNFQESSPLDTTNFPGPVSPDLYEIIAGNIYFRDVTTLYFDDNYILYLKGFYKAQTGDSLPTQNLINYVLWTAADQLMNMLLLKATFVFLRNDTQIAAIVAAQKVTEMQSLKYKQRLLRTFEST